MRQVLYILLLISFLQAKNSQVVLQTNSGDIRLILFDDIAPLAVKNFKTLIKKGYYNNIYFHRIIKNFMIQGGDPTGSGAGGESIYGHVFKDEINANYKFDKPGILAMANRGPNTNGSQFFITTVQTPWLNGYYTIFGKVADKKSFMVVKAIESIPTDPHDRPIYRKKATIIKAYVVEK